LFFLSFIGAPYGNRTRVSAVKGRCPRPLDEGREAPAIAGAHSLHDLSKSDIRVGIMLKARDI
jgi:hypothetical protein